VPADVSLPPDVGSVGVVGPALLIVAAVGVDDPSALSRPSSPQPPAIAAPPIMIPRTLRAEPNIFLAYHGTRTPPTPYLSLETAGRSRPRVGSYPPEAAG
jgi:hypothetical protein